ncbi:hypothetical protein C3B48_03670 [Flavobacterium columnare]|nr:hypothetical protein [Flavobacterium columnare]
MKMLKNLLKTLGLYKKNETIVDVLEQQRIVEDFRDSDKIARTIFSPFNFKKNKQNLFTKATLNKSAFETPPELDEVSVNRLDYTTSDNLKYLSKLIDIPSDDNRNYCGIAIIDVSEIRTVNADIVYTPTYINNINIANFPNPFHSDIKIGYVKERGVPLPQEFSYKANKMTEICRYYPDPNPSGDNWNGGVLE